MGRSSYSVINERSPCNHESKAISHVVAPTGRDELQVGPFQATFHPKSTNPYLNYAIPRDAAEPTQPEVVALISAYRQRGRRARLEYVGDLAPRVEQALLARGFQIEGRLPLMAFGGSDIVKVQPPEGIDLVIPTTDEDLYAMATVQAEANGKDVPDLGIVADRRTALDHGSLAMVARDLDANIVAAGSSSPIHDGLSEIAGSERSPHSAAGGLPPPRPASGLRTHGPWC